MEHAFQILETPAAPVLCKKVRSPVGELPALLGQVFQELAQYLVAQGQPPSQAPYVAYFNLDMENLDLEIGFPLTKKVEGQGDLLAGEIPAGTKATAIHRGPYDQLAPVYDSLNTYIADQGYIPTGVVYEYYLNSPAEVAMEDLLTQIVFLLKPKS